jgi:outer membrane protein assembly factor BamB
MLLAVVGGLTGLGCIKGLQAVGWSGGVIADGTLFVGSEEGRLVAINMADGSRQWSEALTKPSSGGFGCAAPAAGGGCSAAPAGVAIYGTPAVADSLVYIGGYNGKIYAFNSSSLALRWVYPREDYLDEPVVGGPAVAQGKVYIGDSDGKLYALNAETGDREWEFTTGDKIWATPAIDGDILYIGSFDKKLYALNAADGSKRWEFKAEGAIAAIPLVYNNTVYIGSFDRYLYAVSADNGNLKWKFMGGNWFWAEPVAYDGNIYAGCLDGKVYVLDAETGDEIIDAFDLGSPVSSSPVVVDGSVIFASQKGVIYAINTSSNEIRQLADVGKNVYGPLLANEGVVYVHTQDLTLHPIDASTGAELQTISLKSGE